MNTPAKRQPMIISMGEVLWDLFPTGPCFGGAAANFACHAVALGAQVAIVSAVGPDANGREARAILASLGVNTGLLQETAGQPTGSVSVAIDSAGKPVFTINKGAAWDRIAWTDELAASIPAADAIYFGTLAQRSSESRTTIRMAVTMAMAAGVPRVLDVNLRPPFFEDTLIRESIALCSVLKLSDDEFPAVTAACGIPTSNGVVAALLELLNRYGIDLIAMTRGADGALLVTRDETIDQPGIATEVCDTVGAGDSFTAALVTGLLTKAPLASIARRACETASRVCSHPGAIPQLAGSKSGQAAGAAR